MFNITAIAHNAKLWDPWTYICEVTILQLIQIQNGGRAV